MRKAVNILNNEKPSLKIREVSGRNTKAFYYILNIK